MKALLTAVLLSLVAGVASAGILDTSLRPLARPALEADAVMVATSGPILPLRPLTRPLSEQERAMAEIDASYAPVRPSKSLRPWARPESLLKLVMAKKRAKRKGSVCGDLDIQGEVVGSVPGRIRACGIKDAVRVTSVSDVALSTGALMDCTTADALKTWTEKSVKPTFRDRGPVVSMKVAAHYACRTRNHRPGAKISEHGKGRAIDISAFRMQDGEVITVLNGWRSGSTRRLLQSVHRGACGPFGTVLGPNSDRYHQDHFHFDTARHRGGPYCR
ncbi:MAG: extensin family protein [Pseudomonadota bacterium]